MDFFVALLCLEVHSFLSKRRDEYIPREYPVIIIPSLFYCSFDGFLRRGTCCRMARMCRFTGSVNGAHLLLEKPSAHA